MLLVNNVTIFSSRSHISFFAFLQKLALLQLVLKHIPKHINITHTMTGDSTFVATEQNALSCLQKELDLIKSSTIMKQGLKDMLQAQSETDLLLSQLLTTDNTNCIPQIL